MHTSANLLHRAPTDDEYQGSRGDDGHRKVAHARIDCQPNGGWQARIKHAIDAETELRHNPSHRIDHRRDAGVRGANHRQALLDRAQPRLLEMLIRAGRNSKPAIVWQVAEPARPVIARRDVPGKNNLIADQRQNLWRARYLQRAAGIARNETALNPGELFEPKPLHPILQRQIFAE